MKRHPVDPFSLVFGATFALVGLTFLFTRVDVGLTGLRWIWPAPLIILGALVIFLGARGERADRLASDEDARAD